MIRVAAPVAVMIHSFRLEQGQTNQMIGNGTRILILSAFLAVIPVQSLLGAPLRDLPVTWTQPDGTTVALLVSGDEYHRHVTDLGGFTVLRDFKTGWLHYADLVDGRLVATELAAGLDDPIAWGLVPNLRSTSDAVMSDIVSRRAAKRSANVTPSTGTINNLFIFIRFQKDDALWDEVATYNQQFNGTAPGEASLRAYFHEISMNAVDVVTTFLPPPDGKWMTAYTAPVARTYYQPWDAVHNPEGYKNDSELQQREHALLKDALAYVEPMIPETIDFDANDDGTFDNVIFMVQGWPDTWSDLLWPHKWEFWEDVYCKGLKVVTYNLQLSVLMLISPGTFVHEMYHSFGAPDLYHYSLDGIDAVGPWDVMDQTGMQAAQHPLAYMKWKYGNWIDDIPLVTENQQIILTPDWVQGTQAVRVNVPESTSEYFVMEYRRKTGMFESSLPGSGLLVYRIDPYQEGEGNRNGPPDEVWVFRPDGQPYATGEIKRAPMRADGRAVMNTVTNPSPYLGDQTPVTLRVYDVGEVGGNIAFRVCLNPPGCQERVCGDDGCGGWCGDCPSGYWCDTGACAACSCAGRECGDDGCGVPCGACEDENQCTTDSCVDFACVFEVDENAACDDEDPCTSGDTCNQEGVCTGQSYVCSPGQCEEISVCDGEGGCQITFRPQGYSCQDGEGVCNDERCAEPRCDGFGACTMVNVADGTPCDDGDPDTEEDQCDEQGFCRGTPKTSQDVIVGELPDPDADQDTKDNDASGSDIENDDSGCCSQGNAGHPTAVLMLILFCAIVIFRRLSNA